jgi:hypothetical protein
LRVERDEAAIERAEDHLVLPHRDAAIDDVAAAVAGDLARHLRVVFPQELAAARLERVDDRVGAGRVHAAVDDDRRRLGAAVDVDLVVPGEAELVDVLVVDLVERAVALLVVSAAVREPVAGLLVGGQDARAVDGRRGMSRSKDEGGKRCGDDLARAHSSVSSSGGRQFSLVPRGTPRAAC